VNQATDRYGADAAARREPWAGLCARHGPAQEVRRTPTFFFFFFFFWGAPPCNGHHSPPLRRRGAADSHIDG